MNFLFIYILWYLIIFDFHIFNDPSCRFQALIPEEGMECPIVDNLRCGEVPYQQRSRKYSFILLSPFFLPGTDSSLQPFKIQCYEEGSGGGGRLWMLNKIKYRGHSLCHICMFRLRNKNPGIIWGKLFFGGLDLFEKRYVYLFCLMF